MIYVFNSNSIGADMFDVEKLLGKVVREVTGSSYGKKGKKYKKHKGNKNYKSHSNPLVSNLKSGAGLMTAIGLGIGAYEILKNKSQATAQPSSAGQPYSHPVPPQPPGQMSSPPPPPLPPRGSQTATNPEANHTQAVPAATPQKLTGITTEDLATRLIQTMIAAAHADGSMDEQEEQAILERMRGDELSQEERMFLLNELHNPKTIAELTNGITDPSAAKAMYMLAVSTIEIDTDSERQWMDQLAAELGLSKAVQNFIEEQ